MTISRTAQPYFALPPNSSIAASTLFTHRSRPIAAIVSNSGGAIVVPVTATRTGVKS